LEPFLVMKRRRMPQIETSKKRVNEIDLLRFIAAISVVLFHYSFRGYAADNLSILSYPALAPYSKYGYLGVNLFFMISGFVILMTASSGSLKDFFVSRFVRLYPTFWVCCTATFLVTIAIGGTRFSASFPQYFINMISLRGFSEFPSMDGAYWSLLVELHFYVFVAVVLAMRKIQSAQFLLTVWLISSIALEVFPIKFLQVHLLVDYAAYFIGGATYFLVWSQGASFARVSVIAGSFLLAASQEIKDCKDFIQQYHTSISLTCTIIIIGIFFTVFLLLSLRVFAFKSSRLLLLVGSLTYPLYLIHQNIGYMIFNLAYPTMNQHLLLWGTLVLMLGIAYAVSKLVEQAISKPAKSLARSLAYWVEKKLPRFFQEESCK